MFTSCLRIKSAKSEQQELTLKMLSSSNLSCRHKCFHFNFLRSSSITMLLLLIVVISSCFSRTVAFGTHYQVCVNRTRFDEVRLNGLGPACIGVSLKDKDGQTGSSEAPELSTGFDSSCFRSYTCTLSLIVYKDDKLSPTSKFALYAESFKNDTVAIVPVVEFYLTSEPIKSFEVHPLDINYGTVVPKNLGGGKTPLGVYNMHTGVATLKLSNQSDPSSEKVLKRYLMTGKYTLDRIYGYSGHIFSSLVVNGVSKTSAEMVFAAKDRIYDKHSESKNSPDFDWTSSAVFVYGHLYHQVYRRKGESKTGQWTKDGQMRHVVSLSFEKSVFLLKDFVQHEDDFEKSLGFNNQNRMPVLPPSDRKVSSHEDSLNVSSFTPTTTSTSTLPAIKWNDGNAEASETSSTKTVKSMESLVESNANNREDGDERVTSSSMTLDNNMSSKSSSLNSVQLDDDRTDSRILTEGLEQRPLLQEHHKQGEKLDTKLLVITGIILTAVFVVTATALTIFITLKTKSRSLEEHVVRSESIEVSKAV